MSKNKNILIVKANGDKVPFDASKLERSLKRSKATEDVIQNIIQEVEKMLVDGISTKKIYKKAFDLLRKTSGHTAARYKLKNALYEFGPSGFPFEQFVARIMKHEGFKTKTNVIVQGHCVNHEVDVAAEKADKHFMVECKFHSDSGRFCNVKVPLYIHSRFQDVEKQWVKQSGHETKFHQGWIVTNTRFTTDAVQYGNCSGLMLIGWDHPKNESLKDRIDKLGLHPITCLTTLSKKEKDQLLTKEKVLCMDLCHEPELLKNIGVSEQRQKNILAEAYALCGL